MTRPLCFHDHYGRFLATAEQSAPLRRISLSALRLGPLWAFTLGIDG
jgi:hypothetical protein